MEFRKDINWNFVDTYIVRILQCDYRQYIHKCINEYVDYFDMPGDM